MPRPQYFRAGALLCGAALLIASTLAAGPAAAREIVIGDKFFITTINDIYINLEEEYLDTKVTFEGSVVRGELDDPDLEGKEFVMVYRLGPGCCYNDAYAGMYLDYDGEMPPDDSWVRVSGYPYYYEHGGLTELFIKVDTLEKLPQAGKLTVAD